MPDHGGMNGDARVPVHSAQGLALAASLVNSCLGGGPTPGDLPGPMPGECPRSPAPVCGKQARDAGKVYFVRVFEVG